MIFFAWILVTLWLLIKMRMSAGYVFGGSLMIFYALGFIDTQQLLSNMMNESIMVLLLLIIVTLPLAKNIWLSFIIKKLCNGGERRALCGLLLFTTGISAFVNNTAVMAMLLQQINQQKKILPSRILLPLSYAAMLGGTLTLIGTSTNLLVNGLIIDAGYTALSIFSFTKVALPAVVIVLVVIYWQAKKLPSYERGVAEDTQYLLQALVLPLSSLCGKRVADCGLRSLDGLFLLQILRKDGMVYSASSETRLQAGDKLLFTGNPEKIHQLNRIKGLRLCSERGRECFISEEEQLYKVLVRPQASIIGQTLKESNFRYRFNAAVVAIRQRGSVYSGGEQQVALCAGDVLVLAAEKDFAHHKQAKNDFFVFDHVNLNQYMVGWKALGLLLIFITLLMLSIMGVLSLLKGLLLFLTGLLATGSLSVDDIKENFPIELMVVMVAALCFADFFADSNFVHQAITWIQYYFYQHSGTLVVLGLYLITLLLTQVITNHAAAALMTPLALQLAEGFSVSIMPMIMAVAFAASAAFISPFAYHTHLMIFNIGSYKIHDFLFFGWRLVIVYSLMVLLGIFIVYPL